MLFPVSSKFQDGIRLVKSSLLTCKLLFLSERIGLTPQFFVRFPYRNEMGLHEQAIRWKVQLV